MLDPSVESLATSRNGDPRVDDISFERRRITGGTKNAGLGWGGLPKASIEYDNSDFTVPKSDCTT